ncbi:hypothetical protein ABW21_db0204700 [Orbilia brochopaga]|nr:hypothetical protein ABW21_db0204700 [Drechslerella brochopaga]
MVCNGEIDKAHYYRPSQQALVVQRILNSPYRVCLEGIPWLFHRDTVWPLGPAAWCSDETFEEYMNRARRNRLIDYVNQREQELLDEEIEAEDERIIARLKARGEMQRVERTGLDGNPLRASGSRQRKRTKVERSLGLENLDQVPIAESRTLLSTGAFGTVRRSSPVTDPTALVHRIRAAQNVKTTEDNNENVL